MKIIFHPNYAGIQIDNVLFECSPLKFRLLDNKPIKPEIFPLANALFNSGINIPYQEYCQGELILGHAINYYVRAIDYNKKRTLTAYTERQLAAIKKNPYALNYIVVQNSKVTFYDIVQALNLYNQSHC